MTSDVPNALSRRICLNQKNTNYMWLWIFSGVIVDLLAEITPEIYGPHDAHENGCKLLYVLVLKDLYVILVASALW